MTHSLVQDDQQLKGAAWCSAEPHHMTLLDGEMVVDDDVVGDSQARRFLAYDIMLLQGQPLMDRRFKVC